MLMVSTLTCMQLAPKSTHQSWRTWCKRLTPSLPASQGLPSLPLTPAPLGWLTGAQ